MISLSRGVWGKVFAPRSRALCGKSGISRAEPLMQRARKLLTTCLVSLSFPAALIALLGVFAFWVGPPPNPLPLLIFTQADSCDGIGQLRPVCMIKRIEMSGASWTRASAQPVTSATKRGGVACLGTTPARPAPTSL